MHVNNKSVGNKKLNVGDVVKVSMSGGEYYYLVCKTHNYVEDKDIFYLQGLTGVDIFGGLNNYSVGDLLKELSSVRFKIFDSKKFELGIIDKESLY